MKDFELIAQHFKQIEMEKVFYFYDEPVLYTCFIEDIRFLALLINIKNNEQVWFYAVIENDAYEKLLENQIDLYSIFKFPKSGIVYKIVIDKENEYFLSTLAPKDILDIDLPDKGIFLSENQGRENTTS